MQVQYYTQADRTIIVAPKIAIDEVERLLTSENSKQDAKQQLAGRGKVHFISYKNKNYVLRHYYRGGLYSKLVADSYLYIAKQYTRPWREWHLLWNLHIQGLPVPRPLAAVIYHSGLLYRGDLLTAEISHAQSLAQLLAHAPAEKQLWQSIGNTIKMFHLKGVYHADLNAHNILIDAEKKIWLLDFDRGCIRSPNTWWQNNNLKRLQRSLLKLQQHSFINFQETDWACLLKAYHNTSNHL